MSGRAGFELVQKAVAAGVGCAGRRGRADVARGGPCRAPVWCSTASRRRTAPFDTPESHRRRQASGPRLCRCPGSRCLHDHRTPRVLVWPWPPAWRPASCSAVVSRREPTRASWPGSTRSWRTPASQPPAPGRRRRRVDPAGRGQPRAAEIEAGRQAMVEQFRLLSHEVAEQQRRSVDTTAAQRMQATEQVLAPVAGEPQGVPGAAHRRREGARPDRDRDAVPGPHGARHR